ncbi:hypothetical protein SAMN05519103_00305 [Rhizobiales bacterium GAS113]|nr:hypothetical protein SAMN05519103_00305 [Rhizobiales bacterium GAS113]
MSERKLGHSKLVYDKTKRTIVAVDPHPMTTPPERITEAHAMTEREEIEAALKKSQGSWSDIWHSLPKLRAAALPFPPPLETPNERDSYSHHRRWRRLVWPLY